MSLALDMTDFTTIKQKFCSEFSGHQISGWVERNEQ